MAEAAEAAVTPASPGDAADKAAMLDALDAEFAAEGGDEPAPPRKEKPSKGKSDDSQPDDGDDESAVALDEESSDDGEGGTEEDKSEESFSTVDEFREHAKELLEQDGGPRKLEELLGLEKGTLKVNGSRIRFVKEQTRKAEETLATAQTEKANADDVMRQARDKYGTYAQSTVAFASGTPQGVLAAARAIEQQYKVPLATFVDMVVKAGRGEASPAVQHQHQGNSEIAELKANQEKLFNLLQQERAQAGEAAQKAKDVAKIGAALKGTELAKLKDGGARVYDAIVKSMDPITGGFKLNFKTAVKAVLDDKATKYDLLQLRNRKGVTAPGKAAPTPPSGPQRKRVAAVAGKPLTEAQKEERERLDLIAELEADERKQERLAKRSNGRR